MAVALSSAPRQSLMVAGSIQVPVGSLQSLRAEAEQLHANVSDLGSKTAQVVASVAAEYTTLINTLRPMGEKAITRIIQLGDEIEKLAADQNSTQHDALIADCKAGSIALHNAFDDAYNSAKSALDAATKEATEIVYDESQTETDETRVKQIIALATVILASNKSNLQFQQDRVNTESQAEQTATNARNDAESKLKNAKNVRIVRDVFTLGLGEAGDWGSLNKEMSDAESALRTADNNLEQAQKDYAAAQSAVTSALADIAAITALLPDLQRLGAIFQTERAQLEQTRAKLNDFTNTCLDLANYFGSLDAQSAPLEYIHNAAGLASAVVSLQNTLGCNTKLSGPFLTAPSSLDGPLEQIAKSTVPAGPVTSLM
ncbi:uncharacterized protein FIBRA_04094 [Fibroporia radiculosa]|uniref:Uncharacterized protein n=1 Tax=Fibroporia radiculosa TaxID=599839 RepID=J4G6U5_9APHY|nr:uncharacterized protein FIBRA_04094 [Fibroporia radiculosa]CCM02018.1 predicted protein [Fibroporia radiculosa]